MSFATPRCMSRGAMYFARQSLFRLCLPLSSLFLVLLVEKGNANCLFEVPPCTATLIEGSVAEYVIHGHGDGEAERICINSESSKIDLDALTVRIRYDQAGLGKFCSDVEFEDDEACVAYGNLPGVGDTSFMLFNASTLTGDNGSLELNFIMNGELRAQVLLFYAPTGLHTLYSSTVKVTAGDALSLSWLTFDVDSAPTISTPDMAIPSNGSLTERAPWTNCIIPSPAESGNQSSFIQPNRPELIQYVVSSINIEEAGIYTLEANGTYSSPIQVLVVLLSAPPQLVVGGTSTIFLKMGSAETVACDVVGTLRPPAWLLDNVPLSSKPDLTIGEGGLTFLSPKVSQSGWYTCLAANQWGQTEQDFLIIVTVPVSITVPPKSYSVRPGTPVVVPCGTQGLPAPNVEWFVNDTDVSFDIEPVSTALIIENYTGTQLQIRCQATSVFQPNVSSMPITVTTLPEDNPVPESNMSSYYHIAAQESISLTCSDSLSDEYHYVWLKDHAVYRSEMPGSLGVRITVSGSGDGSGYYCCQMMLNDSMLLDTRCAVVNVRLPPMLRMEPSNTSIAVGRDVELLCSATTDNGIGYPLLSWYNGSQRLPDTSTDPRLSYEQDAYGFTTLQIRNVRIDDGGVYRCEGDHFVAAVVVAAELRVVEPACASTVLGSSGAEEDVDVVHSSWNFSAPVGGDPVAGVVDVNGEKVFTLIYQSNSAVPPEISQVVALSASTSGVRLSARMRTSNSDLQPLIELTRTNATEVVNLASLSLPFPSRLSWQWVESSVVDVNGTEMELGSLQVTMTFVGMAALGSEVFFDDVCLEVVEGTSVETSTIPSTPSDLNLTFYLIMICIVAGLAAILFMVIFVFCVCCLCAVKRKKRRESNYQPKNDDIPLEKVMKYPKEVDSVRLTGASLKRVEAESLPLDSGTSPVRQNLANRQQLFSQSVSSSHIPVSTADSHQPRVMSLNRVPVDYRSLSHPHQTPSDHSNPSIYMPLNPLSLENESMYMAPGETPVHKTSNATAPCEVEEVYDMPPLLDEMYDIVPDMSQPSTRQNGNRPSDDDHYYI